MLVSCAARLSSARSDTTEAEEQFKKVLASDPEHASALNYLGYMLADQKCKLEEALGYIKQAVDLDPANGAYLDSLGWAYFRLGKYDLAEENLTKAPRRRSTPILRCRTTWATCTRRPDA